jgi:tRNA A-37 threonylcarbamoyl transferase component Bud32
VRYERVSRLGRGGMGVVDLARTDDGTEVALKRLTLHGSSEDLARARQRIQREAEVLQRLHHRNVVELLDVAQDGDDVVLVMPYLPGGTLADRVAHHGPAPTAEVERLAADLSSALAAAHRAGIVHRDIKPANVLFDAHGVPHLADFGVASSREHTAGLTAVGTVVGTASFMAPEQARGEVAGQAADVFSLGATLRFAATGEGPYGAGAPELLMHRAADGRVQPLPRTLPAPLRARLNAMLDPRPERRPSAAALVRGPEGTAVRRPVVPARRARRWPIWAGLCVAGALALVAGIAVAARETRSADGPRTTAGPTTTACRALPYQPCGATEPAPGTDGQGCIDEREDYDADAANGCEAAPDGIADGSPLVDSVQATVVPRDDVDTFTMEVGDGRQLLCDGRFVVTLTAPVGVTLRLEVLEGDDVLGETTSADGVPSPVSLSEQECFFDDSATLTARVSPIGSDRTAEPYLLERGGSF